MRNSQNPSDTMGLALGCAAPFILLAVLYGVAVLLHHSPILLLILFIGFWSFFTFRLVRWIVTS